ncbi:MAG: ornithine-acyl ACP N-acyltransferase [Micavibrio sp.]|nr:MAG: ornithine-acyl ACP N-acyltransferase [Micavibrio sp.]
MTTKKTDIETVSVRLARSHEEIEEAQRLRYQVFYEEYDATPTSEMTKRRRDMDDLDEIADHLVVIDNSSGKERIVGTYRLLQRDAADNHGGFYSSGEYDLSTILNADISLLELGRSCVLPEFRSRPVLQLLWQGIGGYITEHNIGLLFGCGSLHGTEVTNISRPLSYMYHYHMAPDNIRVRALEHRYINMDIIPKDELDPKVVFNELPPLLKGYLRIGAKVGDGAVIDPQFNTTDVFIVMPTDAMTQRYRAHYERKNQKPMPGGKEPLQDIAAFMGGTARGTV